jgi:hypothetical protein
VGRSGLQRSDSGRPVASRVVGQKRGMWPAIVIEIVRARRWLKGHGHVDVAMAVVDLDTLFMSTIVNQHCRIKQPHPRQMALVQKNRHLHFLFPDCFFPGNGERRVNRSPRVQPPSHADLPLRI